MTLTDRFIIYLSGCCRCFIYIWRSAPFGLIYNSTYGHHVKYRLVGILRSSSIN